jgi:hypothetical protein
MLLTQLRVDYNIRMRNIGLEIIIYEVTSGLENTGCRPLAHEAETFGKKLESASSTSLNKSLRLVNRSVAREC